MATLLAAAALGAGGCAATGEVESVAGDGALQIEVASAAEGVRASMLLDGETILVESRAADGVRATSVTGEDGTPYARWTTRLTDLDTEGSYGEQSFGRVADAATDMDLELWAPIAASRVGEVLDAVSQGAAAARAAGSWPEAAAELDTLAAIGPSLQGMARPRDGSGEVEQGTECNYWNAAGWLSVCGWTLDHAATAFTGRPYGHCTRRYYAAIYHSTGQFITSGSCAGAECNAWNGKRLGFYSYTCGCYLSKHWDGLNIGLPSWRSDCGG
jgi:hypothetical protein